jgi:hypothetical protein
MNNKCHEANNTKQCVTGHIMRNFVESKISLHLKCTLPSLYSHEIQTISSCNAMSD